MNLSGKEIKACIAHMSKDGWSPMDDSMMQMSTKLADLEDYTEYNVDWMPMFQHEHFQNPMCFEDAYQSFMSKRRTEKIQKDKPVVKHPQNRIAAAAERYASASHAVMTGNRFLIDAKPKTMEPKQTRTGIDLAHSSHAALVKLLIKKGIIDEADYYEFMADAAEEEKRRLEKELSNITGKNITLH